MIFLFVSAVLNNYCIGDGKLFRSKRDCAFEQFLLETGYAVPKKVCMKTCYAPLFFSVTQLACHITIAPFYLEFFILSHASALTLFSCMILSTLFSLSKKGNFQSRQKSLTLPNCEMNKHMTTLWYLARYFFTACHACMMKIASISVLFRLVKSIGKKKTQEGHKG